MVYTHKYTTRKNKRNALLLKLANQLPMFFRTVRPVFTDVVFDMIVAAIIPVVVEIAFVADDMIVIRFLPMKYGEIMFGAIFCNK